MSQTNSIQDGAVETATLGAQFENAVSCLAMGQVQLASRSFAKLADAGFQPADSLIFLGMCAYLDGDKSGAVETLEWSKTCGPISGQFFVCLGRVLTGLGIERGDDLRLFLQKHRAIPWQMIGAVMAGTKQTAAEPWFYSREAMNPFPKRQSEFSNLPELIEKSVLTGFLPEQPPFQQSSSILTIGSCFAEELRNYLVEAGMRSDWIFMPPGLNNTYAIRQFFEWCATGNQSSDAYWYDEATGGGASKWRPDFENRQYRAILKHIDGLVLTIGLAEIWQDESTGGVFWRGVPKSIYDPAKHKCRMTNVEENVANLNRAIDVLRSINPDLPIVLTLSPVPLKATFEDVSCIAADSVSKSVLRVAIDQVTKRRVPGVTYWPSFEIVRWLGSHIDAALFGEDGNTRHVNRSAVRLILDSFIRHYFKNSAAPAPTN